MTRAASAPAGGSGYPLTMEHAMGSTTIESEPKRVIALDPSYIDAALLLKADLIGYVQYRQDPGDPFADDETFVATVSIQGAHAVITDLAEHYGVDPQLP